MTMTNENAISVIHLVICSLWAFVAYIHGFRRGMVFGWNACRDELKPPPGTEE